MIIDITGIPLTPGKNGTDCLGNGQHYDNQGRKIECCCDECDYMLCCWEIHNPSECESCKDITCPKAGGAKT